MATMVTTVTTAMEAVAPPLNLLNLVVVQAGSMLRTPESPTRLR